MVYEMLLVPVEGKIRRIFSKELDMDFVQEMIEGYAEKIKVTYEDFTRDAFVSETQTGLCNDRLTTMRAEYLARNGHELSRPEVLRGSGVVVIRKSVG